MLVLSTVFSTDGIGCFKIKIGADTAKFTNVRIAGFG